MISKAHIISFAVVVCLYAGVAVWKWSPAAVDNPQNSINQPATTEKSIESQFWDHYDRATKFRSGQLYQKAAEEYSKALALNNNHKDALYYAGSMYLMNREFEAANQKWKQLLEAEPNAPRTNLRLGTLHFCMDKKNPYFDLDKAYHYFSEAWNLNLEETGAPLLLAKIYLLHNNSELAEDLLADILSLNNTNEQALFLMGFIKWSEKQHNEARQYLNKSRGYFHKETNKGHLGEGATKTGNAMLLQDRYCDDFENTFEKLLQDYSTSPADKIYSVFTTRILEWRNDFDLSD